MVLWVVLSLLFTVCMAVQLDLRAYQITRIIGGEPVEIEDAPYLVALTIPGFGHNCGGAIVASNVVVTAAHCAVRDPRRYVVRAGSRLHQSGGSEHRVNNHLVHPSYNARTNDYDVAVLFVDPPFDLDTTRQTIRISEQEPTPGDAIYSTGWGRTRGGGPVSPQLFGITVTAISPSQCSELFDGYEGPGQLPTVTSRMFCTMEDNRAQCQGDSGGPLVRDGDLVGVVSWGTPPCLLGFPTVHAKLANVAIRSWLREVASV